MEGESEGRNAIARIALRMTTDEGRAATRNTGQEAYTLPAPGSSAQKRR